MELYYDGFVVILENTEENYAIYADKFMGFFIMSVAVARYIAKKCYENWEYGYRLLDWVRGK